MITEKTIHGQNSLKLFEKYQTNSKGQVRWVEGKRCGEYITPSEKLKLKIQNSKLCQTQNS